MGVLSLRVYLESLLDKHIQRELPKVRTEIKDLIKTTRQCLALLGDERPSVGHMRLFLSRVAVRFHTLTTSALNGTYHEADSVFFSKHNRDGAAMRLRATVHHLNTAFSNYMRKHGAKRKIVEDDLAEGWATSVSIADVREVSDDGEAQEQICVTPAGMKEWIREVSAFNRSVNSLMIDRYIWTAEARNFLVITIMFFSQSYYMSSPVGGVK